MEYKIAEIFTYLFLVQIFFVYLQKFVFKMKFTSMYCGMVGFSGVDNFDVEKIKILLLSNMTRGVDSTGMYNNGKVVKDIGNAINFLANNEIIPEKLFFAHDRAATVGFKNKDNAHPFQIGNIIGQHNGTLKQIYVLAKSLGLEHKDYEVDSEILLHGLDKLDNYQILKEFSGAAALIWVDKRNPNKLFCFRNSERPLFRGMIGENMYISSISDSLKIIGCSQIKEFKDNYVYVIENGVINVEESKTIKRKQTLPIVCSSPTIYNPKFVKSLWVKRNSYYSVIQGLTEGVYYQIQENKIKSDDIDGKIIVLNDFGKEVTTYLNFFNKRDEIEVNDFVISMYDTNPIVKGEILFVRGIEDRTKLVLEKLPFDGKIYTWDVKHLRKATAEEVADMHIYSDKILSDKKKITMSKIKTKDSTEIFYFEDSEDLMDPNGNRLGSCIITCGSLFESMLNIETAAANVLDALKILEDTKRSDTDKLSALESIESLIKVIVQLSETESDNIFEECFIEYGNDLENE